jgi:hypothetical protein
MTIVAATVSPLNCRWIEWEPVGPVCTRIPGDPRLVTETTCELCEHWTDADGRRVHNPAALGNDRRDPDLEGGTE